jgi:hypothetical protein
MTAVPIEDNSFDLVLSNVAIHNVKGRDARSRQRNIDDDHPTVASCLLLATDLAPGYDPH